MILWKIFRSEFAYLGGRITTWLYVAFLLIFTFVMNLVTTPGDGVYPNNTFHITAITVMGGFIWLVMGANVAGEAAARDVQQRIHSLIYTTPVKKLNYLGGKFLAAFAVNALLLLALPVGVLLSFYLPVMDQGELLPLRPLAYGNVYFLIALPNAFVATALQFAFAALSRQVLASYMASLLLAFFAQILAIATAKLFGNWDLVKLLDPVGVAGIIGNELQTWTATEKNTRLVTLEGMFLLNRVLWAGVAAGLLWFAYLRYKFANPATGSWKARFVRHSEVQAKTSAETAINRATAIKVPQVTPSFGYASHVSQVFTIAWASFKKIAGHPLGLTLVGAMALASAILGSSIMAEFGIPLLPTTQQVTGYLAAPVSSVNSPWVVLPLLILYFVGELVWRERDAGLGDIADAAPVPDWVLFMGKFLGLGGIILVWMALLMAGGIGMQLGLGYDKLEISLYLQVLFGLQLLEYMLFALLALVVHVVVNQKYGGHLAMLLVFSFMAFPSRYGIEHPMLIFGADTGWWYTDMRGFGPTLGPWLWFKLYWIAWALLLAVGGRLLWPRGRAHSLKHRIQLAHRRFTRSTAWVAILGAGLLLTMGSFVFYNTNVLNEYLTSSDIVERKAAYERRYGRYRNSPQPQLTATKLHIYIYPDRQQVVIRGTYTLVNKDLVPIDSIHIGSVSGTEFREVNFNRVAAGVVTDHELSHHIYALEKPLQPGDSVQLNFVVLHKQNGFRHGGAKPLVVENGTYFTNSDLLPGIGYQRYREIKGGVLRKKYRLAARPAVPSLYDREARNKSLSTDQTIFEATIGTAVDEVALAPGILKKTWIAGDRRYFHYKTDAPIGGEYAILSADYKVQESEWNNVAIRIYYHPDHAHNIGRMLRSVKASLSYYTEQFGPYPYPYMTVVERAGSGGGATADAGIIYYGEQYPLLHPDDSPGGFDLPYYILAHEVAHQWWGIARLTPANVEGAGVLIEGLAVYSGMQVLEKNYGEGHLRQYLDFLHTSYEMPRSLATPSLLQANEEFLYYRKGGLAMYALSKYIGQGKVNGALRSLLQKRTSGEITLPTTLDLYQELEELTPDSLQYLLHDLFKENTYWRLKTKQLSAVQAKAGAWEVTLKVQAQKVVVDSTGSENDVPMNDWLEVGLYEEGKGVDEPLYLKMHRIRSGEQTIKMIVPRKPGSGGIDPHHLLIDLRRDDNMMLWSGK
ncbi:M1 family metallopeptidase [Pontibacter sp. SGAir0037]|uniref:ABC transporter permease/M1 family aminopeptidase n=1 Tax=Pontibacter sp. SGAir0037 TaxID=2571030 RepID=UPI0010CCBBEC|nr:M1 family metallopeptidase [Pontibacter sp. SGAir0037]QCR22384.1 ABC transporter permease [Pontibacter sp. SGAir0037]